jgi:hypothetical protein
MVMENLIKLKSDIGVQLTDRELAVRWWDGLSNEEQQNYLSQYLPSFSIDKVDYETQYWIWLKKQTL